MNYKKVSTAVLKLASDLLSNKELARNVIFKKGESFYVYGAYVITPKDDMWVVESVYFSTAKIALVWCILRLSGDSKNAFNAQRLDLEICYMQANIDQYIHHIKKSEQSEDYIAVLRARLAEDIAKRQQLKKQLLIIVELAKYIQIKGTFK